MSRDTEVAKREPRPLAQSEQRPSVTPACDVYENRDEILVVADVPGVTADALAVSLEKGELTALASEYRDCDYHRRFAVPGGIDAAKISAELKNGVLWLHLPKVEAYKPRQIAVHAG